PQHELPDQPPGLTPAETSRDPGHHRVQETRPALIIGMRYRAPDGRRVLYFCHTKQRSRRPSRMSGTPPDRDHPRPPRRPAAPSPRPRSTAAVSEKAFDSAERRIAELLKSEGNTIRALRESPQHRCAPPTPSWTARRRSSKACAKEPA